MDQRAPAKLTAEQAKTTASQSLPTGRPPRPGEQADAERSGWAMEQHRNVHEIHFIASNKARVVSYRANSPAGAYCCPVSHFSRLQKDPEAQKHLKWRPKWRFEMFPTAGTPTSITVGPLPCKDPACSWKHRLIEGFSLTSKVWFTFTESILHRSFLVFFLLSQNSTDSNSLPVPRRVSSQLN